MGTDVRYGRFSWDSEKDRANAEKHGIGFREAVEAFTDIQGIISVDDAHSQSEPRYFCIGRVAGRVVTVRYAARGGLIRIIGAGYWRKGRKLYEKKTTR